MRICNHVFPFKYYQNKNGVQVKKCAKCGHAFDINGVQRSKKRKTNGEDKTTPDYFLKSLNAFDQIFEDADDFDLEYTEAQLLSFAKRYYEYVNELNKEK